MKRILLLALGISLLSSPLFAGMALASIGTDLTNAVKTSMGSWNNAFSSAGVFLFYVLATIELVMVFGMQALRGDLDFGAIMANLIRLTLIFGFWQMLLGTFGLSWMDTIPKSFEKIGISASGTIVSVDTIFGQVGDIYNKLFSSLSFWDSMGESIMLVLVGFVTFIVLIQLGIKVLSNMVFATLAVYMSSLFFAFGVFTLTRQWAINSIVNIIRYGAKYMGVILVIGLGMNLLNIAITATQNNATTGNIFVLLIFALILYSLAHGIEGFIDGYFTGIGGNLDSSMAGGLAKSMLVGAGAVAASTARGAASATSSVMAAAKAGDTAPSNFGGTTSKNTSSDTGKTGNFKSSAKTAAKATAAGVIGGIAGAGVGFAKTMAGKSTHDAGSSTGSFVGKAISVGSKVTSSDIQSGNKENSNDMEISGTIANGSDDEKPSYISGVPGANDDA